MFQTTNQIDTLSLVPLSIDFAMHVLGLGDPHLKQAVAAQSNHAVFMLKVDIPRGKKFKQTLLSIWKGNYNITEICVVPRALNFLMA